MFNKESNAQGSLEYLIIIAAILAISAVVVYFITGSAGNSISSSNFAECKKVASACKSSHLLSPNDPCIDCESACVVKGKDIMTLADGCDSNGACGFCKQGESMNIHKTACNDLDNDGYIGNTSSCLTGTDCNDSNADINPGAVEVCANAVDDNCNGLTDCADSDCSADSACAPAVETNCNNYIDDDGDGVTDCADSDCSADPACSGKVITSCTDITSSGDYVLAENLSGTQGDRPCIDIQADEVTLDCQEHLINGTGAGEGVYAEGRTGVTVENCVISNYDNGIELRSSSNSVVKNNNISNNNQGIWINGGSGNTINDNNLNNNLGLVGIVLDSDSTGNTITSNNINGSDTGILLDGSSNNNINSNFISFANFGINLGSSSNSNTITFNDIDSGGVGINLDSSSNNNINSNHMISPGEGVDLYSSSNDNNIDDNMNCGVNIDDTSTGNYLCGVLAAPETSEPDNECG